MQRRKTIDLQVRSKVEDVLKQAGIERGAWARSALLRRAKPDKETGGFEWMLTTEKPTTVFDWERFDLVDEVLLADGMLVPATGQVVLLDSHMRFSVKNVLGHVRDFEEGVAGEYGARLGMVHFAGDADSVDARNKVEGNHITDGSVGYLPLRSVWIPEGEEVRIGGKTFEGGDKGLRVTYQWLLKEFSLTPIGADVLAKVKRLCGAAA